MFAMLCAMTCSRDQDRRMRAKNEERCELEHERRGHRSPVLRREPPRRQGGQNRRHDQQAVFNREVRIEPAVVAGKHTCADRRRRDADEWCVTSKGSHPG